MSSSEFQTLTEELAEMERTDPAVKAAAASYDAMVQRMSEGRATHPLPCADPACRWHAPKNAERLKVGDPCPVCGPVGTIRLLPGPPEMDCNNCLWTDADDHRSVASCIGITCFEGGHVKGCPTPESAEVIDNG